MKDLDDCLSLIEKTTMATLLELNEKQKEDFLVTARTLKQKEIK